MGVGYDSGMWDATSDCWGLKWICPEATVATNKAPVLIGRGDLMDGKVIKKDFDIDILNGYCFGARKTTANGTQVSINGKYVNVWCNGVLSNPDETVENGEIVTGAQPTCRDLAANGYVATKTEKCYGKYYSEDKYYIECGTGQMPTRLIVLNGATDINYSWNKGPTTEEEAQKLFSKMYSVSQTQKKKYFSE